MTDKSFEDMTASELLRWAALNENDRYGNKIAHARLLSAVEGRDYYRSTDDEDRDALRAIADKIDAELAQARAEGIAEGNNASLRLSARMWANAHGWPDFKQGEGFGAWLDRCAIQHPRYEDGEPVQFGDEDICWRYTINAYGSDSIGWVADAVRKSGELLALSDLDIMAVAETNEEGRVRRRVPEVPLGDGMPVSKGETVYVIESGIERTVKDFGTKLCEGMDGWDGSPWVMFGNGSWMHARDLTHERPVLGVDGKPIAVGDEVWLDEKHSRYAGSSGSEGGYEYSLCGIERQEMLTVEDAHHEVCGRDYIRVGMCNAWCHSSWLTHTPPDTQQKIDEDAEKFYCAYFGGYGACGTCPASVGELSKKSCKQQQIIDLLRRQRELDKRTGGAE